MNSKRKETIARVAEHRFGGVTVVFEDIHDPHNAAAVLRTCDAFGIQDVRFVFENEKKYNPKKIGKASSSSANKWLDYTIYKSTTECVKDLRKQGFSIVVTALCDDATSLPEMDVANETPLAIVFGNEHAGATEEMIRSADTVLYIPMRGFVQSLNISVSAGVILWHITNIWAKTKKHEPYPAYEFLKSLLTK